MRLRTGLRTGSPAQRCPTEPYRGKEESPLYHRDHAFLDSRNEGAPEGRLSFVLTTSLTTLRREAVSTETAFRMVERWAVLDSNQ